MGQVANKVLLLGSTGMAGHLILRYLRELGLHVDDVARNTKLLKPTYVLDAKDTNEIKKIIENGNYDVIINCVGKLNNAVAENPEEGIFLNSYLPHYLAKLLHGTSGRLIQLSTDCVFSGSKGSYVEEDLKDGSSMYAQSKSLGEVVYGGHLTIRTSIIGPELNENGIGLLKWYLNQQGVIKGYTNAYWSGITTLELAKAIFWLIERPEIAGLIHLTNNEKISKHDLLHVLHEKFGNENITSIEPYENFITDKSLLNTRKEICYKVPSYEQMISDLNEWIVQH